MASIGKQDENTTTTKDTMEGVWEIVSLKFIQFTLIQNPAQLHLNGG